MKLGNEYRATKNWPYAISAGCVVYRENSGGIEVLLLSRTPDHAYNNTSLDTYNLPKGHVDRTETLEVAALRETEEEAGVTAEITAYLGSSIRIFTHPVHEIENQKTTHYFAAKWLKDLPEIDGEHDGKEWVSLPEAIQLLSKNPKQEDEIVKRLQDFLELKSA